MTTSTWIMLLLAVSLAATGILIFTQFRARGTIASGQQELLALQSRLDLLEDQHNIMQREVAGLKDQLNTPESATSAESESAYSQAMRLAKQGMDSGEVAAGCGISRGEAELIVALYRASQRS